jgi:hypothetical protein
MKVPTLGGFATTNQDRTSFRIIKLQDRRRKQQKTEMSEWKLHNLRSTALPTPPNYVFLVSLTAKATWRDAPQSETLLPGPPHILSHSPGH